MAAEIRFPVVENLGGRLATALQGSEHYSRNARGQPKEPRHVIAAVSFGRSAGVRAKRRVGGICISEKLLMFASESSAVTEYLNDDLWCHCKLTFV